MFSQTSLSVTSQQRAKGSVDHHRKGATRTAEPSMSRRQSADYFIVHCEAEQAIYDIRDIARNSLFHIGRSVDSQGKYAEPQVQLAETHLANRPCINFRQFVLNPIFRKSCNCNDNFHSQYLRNCK